MRSRRPMGMPSALQTRRRALMSMVASVGAAGFCASGARVCCAHCRARSAIASASTPFVSGTAGPAEPLPPPFIAPSGRGGMRMRVSPRRRRMSRIRIAGISSEMSLTLFSRANRKSSRRVAFSRLSRGSSILLRIMQASMSPGQAEARPGCVATSVRQVGRADADGAAPVAVEHRPGVERLPRDRGDLIERIGRSARSAVLEDQLPPAGVVAGPVDAIRVPLAEAHGTEGVLAVHQNGVDIDEAGRSSQVRSGLRVASVLVDRGVLALDEAEALAGLAVVADFAHHGGGLAGVGLDRLEA